LITRQRHIQVENYISLAENSFDLISSSKVANTLSYSFYKKLRKVLVDKKKSYLYETNVGAGLIRLIPLNYCTFQRKYHEN
jgi:homoserine dehydrogenase